MLKLIQLTFNLKLKMKINLENFAQSIVSE